MTSYDHDGDVRAVSRGAEEGRAEPAAAGERRRSGRRQRAAGGGGGGRGRGGAPAAAATGRRRQAASRRRARRARRSRCRSISTACRSASSRCRAFPSGSTRSCKAGAPARFTTSKPAAGGGRGGAGGGSDAAALSAERSRAAPFVTGVAEYDVSADGRKLLYRTGGGGGARRRRAAARRPPAPSTCSSSTPIATPPQAGQGRLDVDAADVSRAEGGVQADLQRRLAQPARLPLRAEHARRRLAEDEGDVRRSCCRT